MKMEWPLVITLCAMALPSLVSADQFSEELLFKKLPDGHIYAHFNFVIDRGSNESHFDLFPKSLADVFAQYDVDELHMSVTQGLWRHRRWGYPLHFEAPPGTELWAWFNNGVGNVDNQWKRLTSSLSGAFCTSLQFMDAKSTATPRFAFRMDGVSPVKTRPLPANKQLVRYAALPGETPCTNTLTPWTKLLPCHTKAGLGSLLDPHNVFSAAYSSLSIHYIHTCPPGIDECTDPNQQIALSLVLAFNPKTTNLKSHVSLRRMFTRDIQAPCVLATKSKIIVDTESFQPDVIITPETPHLFMHKFHEFDLTSPMSYPLPFDLNIRFKRQKSKEGRMQTNVPLMVHRYLAGYGQRSGTVVCQIDNRLNGHVPIVYTETFPWFLYVYLHSLKIVVTTDESGQSSTLFPTKMHYTPSRLRENPGLLEMAFALPPSSRTTITLDVDYQLLRWTEYPPDANHGFYINSATVTVMLPASEAFVVNTLPREFSSISSYVHHRAENGNMTGLTHLLRLYTESLVVYLPTPDFSMPYNALCLVCTVVAIGFGSVHSLTTKRFILVDPQNPPPSMVAKVKAAILKLKSKISGSGQSAEPEKQKEEKQD